MTLIPSTSDASTIARSTISPPTPSPSILGGGVTLDESTPAPTLVTLPPTDVPLSTERTAETESRFKDEKGALYYLAIFGAIAALLVALGLALFLWVLHTKNSRIATETHNVPF